MNHTPTVSIEFAHSLLDPRNRTESTVGELQFSATLARQLESELESQGIDVDTVILLDDKQLSPGLERNTEAQRLLSLIDVQPDFLVFESDLKQLLPALLEVVQEPRRGRLTTEIERRASRGDQLACSVDIAIWHLLRLGILRPPPRSTEPLTPPLGELGPYALAVSILPRYLKEYEDKAQRENLSAVSRTLSQRIEILYVESSQGIERARDEINQAGIIIGGKLNVNNSHH